MKASKAIKFVVLFALAFLLPFKGMLIQAEGIVGMSSPDDVQRGYSFTVTLTATGAAAGVDVVQLYLRYPQESVQFIKADSTFMGVEGSQVASSDDQVFDLQDKSGGVVQMLAMQAYAPADEVIAELVFTAKVDAPIGKASFQFIDDSYVSVGGLRVEATSDLLTLEVTDVLAEPLSDEPLPPGDLPGETPPPSLDIPYDENKQLAPASDLEGDGAQYGIGALNSDPAETTAEQTSASSMPTIPETKATEKTQPEATASPLRSVSGESLYAPQKGLPTDKIPAGFQGGMQEIKGVNVPVIKSAQKQTSYYYLSAGSPDGQADFYRYDEGMDRFKVYDPDKEDEDSDKNKAAFQADRRGGKTWQILLVSLVGLSALSIMIYTLYRNLTR